MFGGGQSLWHEAIHSQMPCWGRCGGRLTLPQGAGYHHRKFTCTFMFFDCKNAFIPISPCIEYIALWLSTKLWGLLDASDFDLFTFKMVSRKTHLKWNLYIMLFCKHSLAAEAFCFRMFIACGIFKYLQYLVPASFNFVWPSFGSYGTFVVWASLPWPLELNPFNASCSKLLLFWEFSVILGSPTTHHF